MQDWKRIGCGIDFSEPSRVAMLRAAALARRLDAELELVHVHEPPPSSGMSTLTASPEAEAMAVAELENVMATWRGEAERLAERPVRTAVLPGDAATELAWLAREHHLDVLVLGTHGRRGLRRLVLGSVAERVAREAPCAVLVVRRPEPAS